MSGGFWSAEPQRAIQETIAAPDQASVLSDNTHLSGCEEEQDSGSRTSLKSLCEDIGIVHIPTVDDEAVIIDSTLLSGCEEELDFLSRTSLKTLCEDIGIVHIPIDNDDAGITESHNSQEGSDELVSNLAVSTDLYAAPVQEQSRKNGSDVPLPTSLSDSIDCYDKATIQTDQISNISDKDIVNGESVHQDLEADASVLTPNKLAQLNDKSKRGNPTSKDLSVVESVTPSSGSETNSTHRNDTHKQEVCLGGQPTIDNFTVNKSLRSRSLTKEEISISRNRSASNRRLVSPKETPIGKRSAKNKTSPNPKTKKSKASKKDNKTKDVTSSVEDSAIDSQSSEHFDYWLNKQVRTTPT